MDKRKNRQLSERLFKKPGSYNVFRSDWGFIRIWIRFLSDLGFGFFRTWISDSTFGSSDLDFGFSSDWISYFFGLDVSKVYITGLS